MENIAPTRLYGGFGKIFEKWSESNINRWFTKRKKPCY